MGTITARKRGDGTTGYTAQIRMKREGKIVHNETQTFERKQAAVAWLRKRESELKEPGALERISMPDPKLAAVIDRYLNEAGGEIGRTKAGVLEAVKRSHLASMRCGTIKSPDIIDFARSLDVQPQTVANYLSHLSAIFSIARPAWGYPLDTQTMKDAFMVAKRLGLTSKSRGRERRPTLLELDHILAHFGDRKQRRPSSNPMQQIVAFAIFSTRRLEEITRIRWADLDERESKVLVRDMKNPGEKRGNDIWCELPPESLRIIQSMPRSAPEIFPYGTDAISTAFTRACKILGIDDLHFHDCRHEGVSRLFELGWSIPRVATVSGHRSWQSLQRYAHYGQTGDKFAGWPWLDVVAPKTAT